MLPTHARTHTQGRSDTQKLRSTVDSREGGGGGDTHPHTRARDEVEQRAGGGGGGGIQKIDPRRTTSLRYGNKIKNRGTIDRPEGKRLETQEGMRNVMGSLRLVKVSERQPSSDDSKAHETTDDRDEPSVAFGDVLTGYVNVHPPETGDEIHRDQDRT